MGFLSLYSIQATWSQLFSLIVINFREVDDDFLVAGNKLTVPDAGSVQHPLGSDCVRPVTVLVGQEDDFLDPRLDDDFRALIAGEQSDIQSAAFHVDAVLVEDRVDLRVTDVHVLVFGRILRVLRPGKSVVAAVNREPVVADADDVLLLIHNAGTDLGRRVFASLSCQEGDSHEIFFPF